MVEADLAPSSRDESEGTDEIRINRCVSTLISYRVLYCYGEEKDCLPSVRHLGKVDSLKGLERSEFAHRHLKFAALASKSPGSVPYLAL